MRLQRNEKMKLGIIGPAWRDVLCRVRDSGCSSGHDGGQAERKSPRMKYLAWIVAALTAVFSVSSALAFETSYWAWQRSEPPSESDLAELSAQEVRTLYWQVGQLENSGNSWQWKARFSLPSIPKIEVIPVLRLESHERAPFTPEATRSLLAAIAAATRGRGQLQIDYDCPDRLLPEYAAVLKQIRKLVPGLSITALPGWIRQPALADLGSSVAEMLPMLYDFASDPVVPGASPVPVIVPEKTRAWLAEWNHCPDSMAGWSAELYAPHGL